jgi:hypothetical protein
MDTFSGLSLACPGRANLGTGPLSLRRGCVGAVRITTPTIMDRASQALAGVLSAGESAPYCAVSEKSSVPRSTLHCRKHGGASIELKTQSQQYLTPDKEKAMVKFLLLMSSFRHPVRIKYIPLLAFSIACRQSTVIKPIKPLGKNWARAFERQHKELKARKVRAINWKCQENNIYPKITEWFEVIGKVLQDPAILSENVYNMDKTGVMQSKLGSVKVLEGRDDLQDYRGAGVKRTMVTAIECISPDGRSLLPLIVWPAATHQSNWTTYSTSG